MHKLVLLLAFGFGVSLLADNAIKVIVPELSFSAVPVYRKVPVEFQYDAASRNDDQAVLLSFRAKYRVADGAPIKKYYYQGRPREILCLQLNGVPLTAENRIFPESRIIRTRLTAYDVCNPYTNAWNLLHADQFEMTPELQLQLPFERPFDFELDVTGLLQNGRNVLHLIPFPPAGGGQDYYTIELQGICLQTRDRAALPQNRGVPSGTVPVGTLPDYQPMPLPPTGFKFSMDRFGGMEIRVNEQTYLLQSLWYWPGKGINVLGRGRGDSAEETWLPTVEYPDGETVKVSAAGKHYKLERTIKIHLTHLDVFDHFSNLQQEITPVVGRNIILGGKTLSTVYAGGVPRNTPEGSKGFEPQNPSIFVAEDNAGLGLMAREDWMRSMVNMFWDRQRKDVHAGFEIWHHVLPPGGSATLHWTIVPTASSDYWEFVNRMRRILETNFTIPGLAVFASTRHPLLRMSDQEIRSYVKNRGIQFFLTDSYRKPDPASPGRLLAVMGTDALNDAAAPSREEFRQFVERIKRAVPEVKVLIYFHSALCSDADAFVKYEGCRALSNGQGISSYAGCILLFPTLTNRYGQDLRKVVELATGEIGADGLYWDEMCTGHVGEADEWCGRFAIVSRDTLQVREVHSFTPLLLDPWVEKMVRDLQQQGKWVIANTNPTTETMTRLHFPRFVEYNNYDSCAQGQLYTPITVTQAERSNSPENILAQAREYLEHGSLTYELAPYNQGPAASIAIDFDNLLKNLYPFTPVFIRPGVMIAEERILISRSGKFGWGDGTLPAEVKIFNERGRPVDGSAWISQDAATGLTKVRLPAAYTGVLLRNP